LGVLAAVVFGSQLQVQLLVPPGERKVRKEGRGWKRGVRSYCRLPDQNSTTISNKHPAKLARGMRITEITPLLQYSLYPPVPSHFPFSPSPCRTILNLIAYSLFKALASIASSHIPLASIHQNSLVFELADGGEEQARGQYGHHCNPRQ
jgi:hypothetical protein